MNSRGHLLFSIAKSLIRMCGGAITFRSGDVRILAFAIIVAEILGVGEELVDRR